MISREEMKNYFLKVNYHALKTEFKHDFDEHTYLKPTFCAHCKGFVGFKYHLIITWRFRINTNISIISLKAMGLD